MVDEIPLYSPCGEGDHTFVRVEKRLRTTEQVARDLARATGVAPRDVGYAGRKDRRAVTRQWYSLPGVAPEQALALDLPGARVLEAVRHRHKLRTGQLAANRFELVVRDVAADVLERAPETLACLEREGFPNGFGEQRFGRDDEGAARGLALLRGKRPPRDRRRARFEVSALQARVFNRVLAERPLPPGRLEAGDVAVVHASGGLFRVEDAALEQPRADAFEISPTGPIFGTRPGIEPGGETAERERAALAAVGVPEPLRAPAGVRLRGGRRALRARPGDARMTVEGNGLRLGFTLPPGSYATVFAEALLGPVGLDDTPSPIGVS